MTSAARISRRRIMSVAVTGGACILIAASRLPEGSHRTASDDTDPLAVVGRAHLDASDGRLDRSELAVALGIPVGATRDEIRRELPRLRPRSTSDFAAGNVVSVGQWILARTEAQVAALVALTPS